MTARMPAACMWIACLSLASAAGCAQRPGGGEESSGQGTHEATPAKPHGAGHNAEAFVGYWSYEREKDCASKYTATLSINHLAGRVARGEWTSYNSETGQEGNVLGELRGDRLLLRFCHASGARAGERACPDFGPATVYVRKRAGNLAWYRIVDDAEIVPGKGTPLEYGCQEKQYASMAQPMPPPAEGPEDSKDLTQPFVGEWAYAQGCGRQHSATLRIEPAMERTVAGTWDDGDSTGGSNGSLIGEVRDGKLHLRFCRDTRDQASGACPALAVEDSYVAREGSRLVWRRRYGETQYVEYLGLHFVARNQPPPLDNDCSE